MLPRKACQTAGSNMTWTYKQSTGELDHDGQRRGTGYAGIAEGLNNPAMQDQHNVGPIPQGIWTIGPALDPPDHLGPLALPLTHVSGEVFGRSAFFIHGDNTAMNHTASNGCIILSRNLRDEINDSDDDSLVVVT
jgi:hypothetical protein